MALTKFGGGEHLSRCVYLPLSNLLGGRMVKRGAGAWMELGGRRANRGRCRFLLLFLLVVLVL